MVRGSNSSRVEEEILKRCSHCEDAFDGSSDATSEESPSQGAGGSVSSALDDDLPFEKGLNTPASPESPLALLPEDPPCLLSNAG